MFRGGHEDENMEMFSTVETIDAIAQSNKPIVVALGHREDRPFIETFADSIFATPSEFAKAITDKIISAKKEKKVIIEQIAKHLSIITSSEVARNNETSNKVVNLFEYCLANESKKIETIKNRIDSQSEAIFLNIQNEIHSSKNRIISLFNTLVKQEVMRLKNHYSNITNSAKSIIKLEKEKKEHLAKLQEQKIKSRNITIAVIVVSVLLISALILFH